MSEREDESAVDGGMLIKAGREDKKEKGVTGSSCSRSGVQYTDRDDHDEDDDDGDILATRKHTHHTPAGREGEISGLI